MSTMPDPLIPASEKPCVMCNDKRGMGAPPKPKKQVNNNLIFQQVFHLDYLPRAQPARCVCPARPVQLRWPQHRSTLSLSLMLS